MEKLRFKRAQKKEWRSKSAFPGAAGLQQDGCEFQANQSYTRGTRPFKTEAGEEEKQQEEEKEEKERRRKEAGEQSSNWWRLSNLPFFVVELGHNSNLSMGMA